MTAIPPGGTYFGAVDFGGPIEGRQGLVLRNGAPFPEVAVDFENVVGLPAGHFSVSFAVPWSWAPGDVVQVACVAELDPTPGMSQKIVWLPAVTICGPTFATLYRT